MLVKAEAGPTSDDFVIAVCSALGGADPRQVTVSSWMRVDQLKQNLQTLTGTPCKYQKLILENGKALDTERTTMKEVGVSLGATVVLIRLPPVGLEASLARNGQHQESYMMPPEWAGRDAVEINVRYLLEAGEEVNIKTDRWKGGTLLHFAAARQLNRTCEMILQDQRFSNVDSLDNLGATALHIAAGNGNAEMCSLFLQVERFKEVNAQDNDCCTALHHAVKSGKSNVCKVFLQAERFVEQNAQDSHGQTALHHAVSSFKKFNFGKRNDDICHVILKAPSFTAVNAKDCTNATALHYAAKCKRQGICMLLLSHSLFTTVNAQDIQGCTALHYAAGAGMLRVCRSLLCGDNESNDLSLQRSVRRHCSKRRQPTSEGNTLLAFLRAWQEKSSASKATPVCMDVHKSGATLINTKDMEDATALHYAAREGKGRVCKLLLKDKRFTEANAKNKSGSTALHCAAKAGFYEACCVILNSCSFTALNAQDNTKSTAMQYAAKKGNINICKLFLKDVRFTEAEPNFEIPGSAFSLAVDWAWRNSFCTRRSKQSFDKHRRLVSMLRPGEDLHCFRKVKGCKALQVKLRHTLTFISRSNEEYGNLRRGCRVKSKNSGRRSKDQKHQHLAFIDTYELYL